MVEGFTYVAAKGATIAVFVDPADVTFVDCRLTLSSSERGGKFYDKTTKAPDSTWCPTASFKVQGGPGAVENVIVQETLHYVDPVSGPQTAYDSIWFQVATAAYAPPTS